MIKVWKIIMEKNLSVRDAENMVKAKQPNQSKKGGH